MQWEELVKIPGIIGKDMQLEEDGHIYRGPISHINIAEPEASFKTLWLAEKIEGRWIKIESLGKSLCGTNKKITCPGEIVDEKIIIGIPYIGMVTIFLSEKDKLNPADILNFQL